MAFEKGAAAARSQIVFLFPIISICRKSFWETACG